MVLSEVNLPEHATFKIALSAQRASSWYASSTFFWAAAYDLKSFKTRLEADLEDEDSSLYNALTGVQYTYDFDLQVFTKSPDGSVVFSDTQQLLMDAIRKNLNMDMSAMMDISNQMTGSMGTQMMSGEIKLWNEMLSGMDGSLISPVLEKQYEFIDGGRWPAAYNEIVLVVDKPLERLMII